MPDRMPRHIVILCHPEQESFNAAVARTYCTAVRGRGHDAIIRDLYATGFQAVLRSVERPGDDRHGMPDVDQELEILRDGDVFVFVYPLWFGGPPAMLKGYVERVLGSGATPQAVHDGNAHSILTSKYLASFTSSAIDADWLDLEGQIDALVTGFDRYIQRAFAMKPARHFHAGAITSATPRDVIEEHLQDVRRHALKICDDLEAGVDRCDD